MIDATVSRLRSLAWQGRDCRNWYATLHGQLEAICHHEGLDLEREAIRFSLLSPRCKFTRNIRRWLAYSLEHRILGDIPRGIIRSLERYEQGLPVRGQKVAAFAAAILGHGNAIVLDVHMSRALDCPQELFANQKQRMLAMRLVRTTAHYVGLSPRDTQACIWGGQIRLSGQSPPMPDLIHEYRVWLDNDRITQR